MTMTLHIESQISHLDEAATDHEHWRRWLGVPVALVGAFLCGAGAVPAGLTILALDATGVGISFYRGRQLDLQREKLQTPHR